MVITENLVRKIVREVLGSTILSEARRASSWEEYVEFTPDNEPDQYDSTEQVQDFVNTYQDFVNEVQKLREDAKTSSAAKAALAVVDDPKKGFQIIEGQTDSYDDYISWYKRFNSSDIGVATRSGINADPPGQKYLHAYQIEVVLFGLLAQINDLTKVVKRVEAAQETEPDNPEVQDEEVVKSKFKQWLERDKKERFAKIKEKLAARKARVKKRRAERKSGKKKSETGSEETPASTSSQTGASDIPSDYPQKIKEIYNKSPEKYGFGKHTSTDQSAAKRFAENDARQMLLKKLGKDKISSRAPEGGRIMTQSGDQFTVYVLMEEFEPPEGIVKEGLSRGSLYRKRYWGRY